MLRRKIAREDRKMIVEETRVGKEKNEKRELRMGQKGTEKEARERDREEDSSLRKSEREPENKEDD